MVAYGKLPIGYEFVKEPTALKVEDWVLDELTFEVVQITEITPIRDVLNDKGEVVVKHSWKGNWYKVNHNYLDGWRYDWELTKVRIKNG